MTGMAPEINWGFSASMRVEEMDRRLTALERELEVLRQIIRDMDTWFRAAHSEAMRRVDG